MDVKKNKKSGNSTPPPEHLSERSKQLWAEAVRKKVKSSARQTLLEIALQSLDLADRCRREIASGELVSKSKRSGLMHRHPLLQTEADSRRQFLKTWQSLGLAGTGNGICADAFSDYGDEEQGEE